MTFVEKSTSQAAHLLKEASELLIVLYKCPNNSIKPYLGIFATAFSNLLKKCLSSVCPMPRDSSLDKNYYIPFHKLEKYFTHYAYYKLNIFLLFFLYFSDVQGYLNKIKAILIMFVVIL